VSHYAETLPRLLRDPDAATARLLKPREAAEILAVPLGRLYELVREEKVPAVRIGRSVRLHPRALEAWIQAGGTAADGP